MRITHFHVVIEPRSMSAKEIEKLRSTFIKAIQICTKIHGDFRVLSVKGRTEENKI